jgi:hypothetical protein
MKPSKGFGITLLAIWLIATGALPLLHIAFPYEHLALELAAIAAGVLLLMGR